MSCLQQIINLSRCKYKKNLADDVHCELYFLQNYIIFFNLGICIQLFTQTIAYNWFAYGPQSALRQNEFSSFTTYWVTQLQAVCSMGTK